MKSILGAAALLACASALADAPGDELPMCVHAAGCRAATQAELDALRGGFQVDTPTGRLHVTIGITRTVSVNDRVVAQSSLLVPHLGGNALIVQNGPGNHAPPASAFNSAALPTIVQNTLDNQKLSTLTIINASANSLSVLKSLRMGEMMSRATAGSGR